jgi:hypothetical protein
MEFEGSIGSVTGKMKKNYCKFSRLSKNLDLSDKKISVWHAPLPPFVNFFTTPKASPLRARKLKFWLS